MSQQSPEACLCDTIAAYLKTQLTGTTGLAASTTISEWPEPTANLALSPTGVVVSVIRAGKGTRSRLGQPVAQKSVLTSATQATVRYEYDQIDVPMTIGLWAMSKRLRDDCDFLLETFLNRPFWSTVSPVASTTITAAAKIGDTQLSVASLANLLPGCTMLLGTGGNQESCIVNNLLSATLIETAAPLLKAHSSGVAFVETTGRRENAATGLSLRATSYFNAVAKYTFDDPQNLDDVENGQNSQRQEWRSIRSGIGSIRVLRDIANVPVQTRVFSEAQASTTDPSAATTTTKRIF